MTLKLKIKRLNDHTYALSLSSKRDHNRFLSPNFKKIVEGNIQFKEGVSVLRNITCLNQHANHFFRTLHKKIFPLLKKKERIPIQALSEKLSENPIICETLDELTTQLQQIFLEISSREFGDEDKHALKMASPRGFEPLLLP